MKRQPVEWEDIFADDKIDKELISRVYKQLMQLSIKKNTQPKQKNVQKIQIDLFLMTYRWPTGLWKDARDITLHVSEWLLLKIIQIISVDKDIKKTESFYPVGGSIN